MSNTKQKKQKSLKKANRLDFYKNRDDTHPINLLYEPPVEDFYGPVDNSERYCTDWFSIPICIIFIAFAGVYGYYGNTIKF
jgi:hypothetical protein